MIRIISLGAGVQSTAMSLMAARGDIGPMPDAAIFADVGDEPSAVYAHLEWLTSVLPFPVVVTSAGHLSADVLAGVKMARPPLFVNDGMLGRQCTRNYKVRPIRRATRKLLGVGPKQRPPAGAAEAWIGISMDEAIRMKPSGVAFITNRWPLIEKRMSRQDCLRWMAERQYPTPPKSSCCYCPYKSDSQWRDLRDNDADGWAKAIAFDKGVRSPKIVALYGAEGFVHRSGKPLDEVDLRTDAEAGQPDLFNNDCEGACGV